MDELLDTMRRKDVERGLLLSPPLRESGCLPNKEVLSLCKMSNEMLTPVITVEPTTKEVNEAVMMAKENQKDVKGFKIRLGYVKASADSPVFGQLYDFAEAEGLPVLFHTGPLPLWQSMVRRRRRDDLQASKRVHRHLRTHNREGWICGEIC